MALDWLIIVAIIVIALILIGMSFYILVVYVHPEDKGWGTALYCKILVILSMALCWTQALMLPLDVVNAHQSLGIDMKLMWFITYMVTLGMITILLPYAIFFYQTDPQKSFLRRMCSAFMFVSVTILVSCAVLFASWYFLRYVDLPIVEIISSDIQLDSTDMITLSQTETSVTLTTECSFVVFAMALMTFIGWCLLILFGGVGLFALPIDAINDYRRRPIPRSSNQVKATRQALIRALDDLIEKGSVLKTETRQINKNKQEKFFKKLSKNRKFGTSFNEFKGKYDLVSEEYQIFQLELSYLDSNPLKSLLSLISGVVFLITALIWTYQITIGYLPTKSDGQPLLPSFNNVFYLIQQSAVSFLASIFYAYLVLYLVWSVIKGNLKFGIRIPFLFKFHPMKPNNTWMNSFLVNMILILLASCAVTQLSANCFSYYAGRSEAFEIFGVQMNYLRFFTYAYQKRIMPGIFLGWTLLVLIFLLFTCSRPPKHVQQIQAIRSGKNKKVYQKIRESDRSRSEQAAEDDDQ